MRSARSGRPSARKVAALARPVFRGDGRAEPGYRVTASEAYDLSGRPNWCFAWC